MRFIVCIICLIYSTNVKECKPLWSNCRRQLYCEQGGRFCKFSNNVDSALKHQNCDVQFHCQLLQLPLSMSSEQWDEEELVSCTNESIVPRKMHKPFQKPEKKH